jgi:hypothetical protein
VRAAGGGGREQTDELEWLRQETHATSRQVMETRQQADALSGHLAWSANQALEKSVRAWAGGERCECWAAQGGGTLLTLPFLAATGAARRRKSWRSGGRRRRSACTWS